MKIVKTGKLTTEQQKEIERLTEVCKKKWNMSLSFPFEDGSTFYMLYAPALVSVLALIIPEKEALYPDADCPVTGECVAFTHPEHQRKGYFSRLLEAAKDEIEDMDILFLTDSSNAGALKTLASLGAEQDFFECRMEISLNQNFQALSSRLSVVFCQENVKTQESGEILLTFHLKPGACPDLNFDCKEAAGKAYAAFYRDSSCLYGFEIHEKLRRLGLGEEALLLFLDYVKSRGSRFLFLHVAGDNEPAMALYKKTGFRLTETLSYYLY